jgi:hypothetical protein
MPGRKRGRLTAIIVNIFGTILTIYLLLQFYSAFYALAIILFSLSVSATQCKSKLKITTPVLFINLSAVSIGTPTALYLFYVALTAENMAPSQWVTPVTISIYVIICLLNVIIIRNLHYSEKGNNDINKD